VFVGEGLLSVAVVTIRSRYGQEVDITDDPDERARRVAAGRVVVSSCEVEALRGAPPQAVVMAMDMIKRFRGAEVESLGPSSGPYPWEGVELPRESPEQTAEKKWW
jgi:hypothetical protein